MFTSESALASYFADIVNDMRSKNIFNSETTFEQIAQHSDTQIALKEINVD